MANLGGVSVSSGKLQFATSVAHRRHAVRRGFRGRKYISECDAPTNAGIPPCAIRLAAYASPAQRGSAIRHSLLLTLSSLPACLT